MKSLLTCLVATCIALASGQADAQNPTQRAQAYLDAGAQLDQRIARQATQKHMPRITEPETAALLAVLSDRDRFLESAPYGVGDIGELMAICGEANRVTMAYALSGLKEQMDGTADAEAITRQMVQLMARNIQSYQPELEQLQPFLLRCLARQVQPMADFMATLPAQELTPVRMAGLQQLRGGLMNAYAGHLQSVDNPALSMSYRTRLLGALAENSPLFAAALLPASRQHIAQAARALLDKAPADSRADLQAIAVAMDTTDCTGLCTY